MNNIKSTISNHNKHTIQEKFSLQQKCFHNNVLWDANVTLPQGNYGSEICYGGSEIKSAKQTVIC